MDSILSTIKNMLGPELDCTDFDTEIIIDINTVLMVLAQLGVGPDVGLTITDDKNSWTELLGDRKDLEAVKTYIYLKVRLIFDPPLNSFLVEAINRQITELEWRIAERAVLPTVISNTTVT